MSAPRVLAILPAFIPSTLISVVKPFVRLHHRGLIRARIVLERSARAADLDWAEVAVFCRNSEPRFAALREGLIARGTPYVYDLDDNLFEIPADASEGRQYHDPVRVAELERYVARAARVRVYSDELLKRVLSLNPLSEKVVPSLDWSLVPAEPPPRPSGPARVVYVTSRLQDDLAQLFLLDVSRLLERYQDRIHFTFWGAMATGRRLPRIRRLRPVPDYDRFLSRLARDGFDIGLAPLVDDTFHRSKTNNKFREYGACRIAGVYSDVSVYSECVRHGTTGLLVPQAAGAWLEAISRLVEDPALRERIQIQAYEEVRARYSQERAEEVWLSQVRELLERPRPGGEAPPDGSQGGALTAGATLRSASQFAGRIARLLRRLGKGGIGAASAEIRWQLYGLRTMWRLSRELGSPPPHAAPPPRNGRATPRD